MHSLINEVLRVKGDYPLPISLMVNQKTQSLNKREGVLFVVDVFSFTGYLTVC